MPTDVVMPQMGESIAEGTIVRWIKKIGDKVDRDEPLFEISTDKVDAEIPAPAAGVITEIRHKEGETVAVNTVVAVIGQANDAPVATPPKQAPAAPQAAAQPVASVPVASPPAPSPQADGASKSAAPAQTIPAAPTPVAPAAAGSSQQAVEAEDDSVRQRSSPLVRRIAKEHNVDISQLRGTGISGRVTRDDILAFIDGNKGQQEGKPQRDGGQERDEKAGSPAPGRQEAQAGSVMTTRPGASAPPPVGAPPPFKPGASDYVEKMSVMRRKIAEHMVASRRTSAHVHSVFEVNFSRVAKIREAKKAEFERAGGKLTFLSFILRSVVEALRAVPVVNASVDGDNIVFHKDINLGVAVALDWGLLVPVIKNAGEKNLLGLSRAVADLAGRARAKQLKPEEVAGGTFTITNPGVFGALLGMPIINQPQVAILGVGAIEKRVVVVEDDAIAIRHMGYLTLGYDHRLIDGAVADQFMSHIKHSLENCDPAAE